jgi:hypothetical protein
MPTDPYVPERLGDEPRQLPNLAPGVVIPPAGRWEADRPGDLVAGQPTGTLLGRPGPNVGYALTLVNRWRDRFRLGPRCSGGHPSRPTWRSRWTCWVTPTTCRST